MKSSRLLVAAVLFLGYPLSAAAIGIVSGVNSSTFSPEYIGSTINTDVDRGVSFEVGAFHDLVVSESASLRIGLEYANRTATESGDWYYYGFDEYYNVLEVYGDAKFDYQVKTISVPVNLIVHSNQAPLFLSLGGNLHLIASAEENGEITGDVYYNGSFQGRASEPIQEDIKDDLKSTELAGSIGGGLNFKVGNQTGLLWLQYEQGFTDLSDINGLDLKSSSLRILFGVIF